MPIRDNVTTKLIQLEKMPERVFEQAMDWAEDDLQRQFDVLLQTNSQNITFRRNGQVITPGTARDLVDLGNLKRSQRRVDGKNETVFTWTGGRGEEYAAYVHDGYVPKFPGGGRGRRVGPRPWTQATIRGLESVIGALIAKELK